METLRLGLFVVHSSTGSKVSVAPQGLCSSICFSCGPGHGPSCCVQGLPGCRAGGRPEAVNAPVVQSVLCSAVGLQEMLCLLPPTGWS